ncbi:threonine/serine dehydratase [Pararhodobacter sp. CCB-MM2]|uniref:threonine ammonia-lyase n=1 Tax=Pararhodobacter sp. CCB-MM2 TaxID=1786003 RepID=UPI00082E87EA|nr:threonine/serine dehydratase [Pararhodobacter sp. CCB-MM2]
MITLTDILAARDRLAGQAVLTPLLEVPALNDLAGGRVLLKAEPLQKTGSFKFRGAYNRIAMMTPEERARGVVAFSAGNHAQGVAAAARRFDMAATIVMPSDAPAIKLRNTRRLGAEVVTYDRQRDDREAIAREVQARSGAILIPPYDDEGVMAGQGTIGLEIAGQCAALGLVPDLLACPVGGGGLMAGIATALAVLLPATRLYAVEPEGHDDTARSLAAGKRLANEGAPASICDAILTAIPGQTTFPVLKAHLTGGVAVSDAAVRDAVNLLYDEAKLVVEPGGAVGLAAILSGALPLDGGSAVVVLSGGNIDRAVFAGDIAV